VFELFDVEFERAIRTGRTSGSPTGFISRHTAWPKVHALETLHAKFPEYAVGRKVTLAAPRYPSVPSV
jgi:hypothetical protein